MQQVRVRVRVRVPPVVKSRKGWIGGVYSDGGGEAAHRMCHSDALIIIGWDRDNEASN